MARVIIVGSGGHAKVVMEILRESPNWELIGCISRQYCGSLVSGVPVLGDDADIPVWRAKGVTHAFVAIGDNAIRARMLETITAAGFDLINAVSSKAIVSPSAILGRGVAVMAGAVINAESTIGDGAVINTGATVDHDCRIGACCHVAPGANLAGCVTLEEGVFLGIGSRIIPKIKVGEWSVVGAGAVVVRDLPPRITAFGVPAKVKLSNRA